MRKNTRLVAALIGLVVVLGGMALYLSWPLLTGTTVVLATRPVDPFDPMRGQYITIGYEIGRLSSLPDAAVGDNVYVLLEKDDGGVWRESGVSRDPFGDGVFIRGAVSSIPGGEMIVMYGIEQFFFEREGECPPGTLTVEAKISKSGQARISRLLIDKEPLELEYRPVSLTS